MRHDEYGNPSPVEHIPQFELIREWAKDKGIYDKGDTKTQYIKLQEEAGELAKAILNKDEPEIIDGLGDVLVVLINLAELSGYKLEDCLAEAYEVISKRKGKMINGTFIKNDIMEVANAWKGYKYFIDGEEIKGDARIYKAVELAGGPELERTHSNMNAYRELGVEVGDSWAPFTYNGHTISREALPKL